MRSLNFLKACAVNSFLKALNNPSEIEGFISDHSILSEQGKADFANFLYEDSLKDENPEIKQAIEECASMWTPAFILAVINANRSSVPYTIQDVDNASAANADILTFGKAGCMDTTMAPSLSKALNTGSVQGYRILPEQSLEKSAANAIGSPGYNDWLRKYREKRGAKAKSDEGAKKEVKEVLESKSKKAESPKSMISSILKDLNKDKDFEDSLMNYADSIENSDIKDSSPELVAAYFNTLKVEDPSDKEIKEAIKSFESQNDIYFDFEGSSIEDVREAREYLDNQDLKSYVKEMVERFN